jgi:CheY-like chemotaxis protein
VNISADESVVRALLVSNDALVIKQVSEPLRDLAASTDICADIPNAIRTVNVRKYEAVVVDLSLGVESTKVLERVRLSSSNRTTVAFAITDGTKQSAEAFVAGSNFVFERPLSPTAVGRTLKAAYSLIVRERIRYFRCPISIPATIHSEDAGEIRGQALNISQGGIAVMTPMPLKPGTKVRVQFTIPGQSREFSVQSEVCWCDEKGRAGLKFLAPSSDLRSELMEWLARRLEQSLPESVAVKFRLTG